MGSILGDGTLRFPHSKCINARFTEAHTIKQKDYLLWKKQRLLEYNPRFVGPYISRARGVEYWVCQIYTSCLKELTVLQRKFYPQGKKVLGDALEYLDPLGLAVWYCDDGSLNHSNNCARLSTESFTLMENLQIKSWLDLNGMFSKVKPSWAEGRFRQVLSAKGRDRLFKIIGDLVPYCMRYKIL